MVSLFLLIICFCSFTNFNRLNIMAITFQDLLSNLGSSSQQSSNDSSNQVFVYLTSSVAFPFVEGMTVSQLFSQNADTLEINASNISEYKMIENEAFITIPGTRAVEAGKTYSIRQSLGEKG